MIPARPWGKGLLNPSHTPTELPPCPPEEDAAASPRPPGKVHGRWTVLLALALLWVRFVLLRRFRPARLPALADEIADRLATFQGYWFDVAERLAGHHGFLRDDAAAEAFLRRCRPAPGLTRADIESVVAGDLGESIDTLFARFESRPVRVGPYAETYRARLRHDHASVEVKIQRPALKQLLDRDLWIMRIVVKLRHWFGEDRNNALEELIDHYAERLPALLDLRYEASAMRRMRRALRDHKLHVPKLYRKFTGRRVLVSESIAAPTLAEVHRLAQHAPITADLWLSDNGIDLGRDGRHLYHSVLRQISEDNFFLLNLLPANVRLLRDNRLAVVSCEETGSVDKRFLSIFNVAMSTFQNEAYGKFVDTLLLLCSSLKAGDLEQLRAELIRAVRTYSARSQLESVDHAEKSLIVLVREMSKILSRNGIVIDPQMGKLMTALANVDQVVSICCPRMNHRTELKRYAKKAAKRRLDDLFAGGTVKAISSLVNPLGEMVRFETASMRRKAQKFEASTGKVAQTAAIVIKWLSRGLIAGGIYGVWLFLRQQRIDPFGLFHDTSAAAPLGNAAHLPLVTWAILLVAIVITYRMLNEVARHLAYEDVNVNKT